LKGTSIEVLVLAVLCEERVKAPLDVYSSLNNDWAQVFIKGSPKAKKPLTGYMLFAKEMRPVVKEEQPELSFGELGKELGARWRALSDDAKAKYKK